MTTGLARIPFAGRLRSDHLVRSSVLNMGSTVVTSLLGFAYWTFAARLATPTAVGYASALMSGAAAASLVSALGVNSLMLERLPHLEGAGGRRWAAFVSSWTWPAAGLSAVVAVAFGLLFERKATGAVGAAWVLPVLALSAACLTALSILDRALLSARRADLGLLVTTALAVGKVASLAGLALAVSDVAVMLYGWAAALVVACTLGLAVVAPRTGFGRVGRPARLRATRSDVVHVLGHHVTSVGGIMTPYLLPLVVLARLDAVSNAYFYTAWMVGSVFFIISPSVAMSLFAEASRDAGALAERTGRALKLLGVLMPVAIVGGIVLGKPVLGVFGPSYAEHGYVLLVILAVSAIPDAFTNVAVSVMRATGRLRFSSALNTGMGVVALAGAWLLMPTLGLGAAGSAWLGAQVLGCVVVAPLMVRTLRARKVTP